MAQFVATETNTLISIDDIKYDLLKIIEPYDGRLDTNEYKPVKSLMLSYLLDLKHSKSIHDFQIEYEIRDQAITYDIAVKIAWNRAPKKLKIHVGKFQYPWISKTKTYRKK